MFRTFLTTLVLIAAPLAAVAECSSRHQQAMSCVQGMVWDDETKSCIKITG